MVDSNLYYENNFGGFHTFSSIFLVLTLFQIWREVVAIKIDGLFAI